MYREILYSDITLAVLIPFCILIVLKVGMAIIAKVKRQRKRRLIEYGIKDYVRQISG
jgi:hypothetical protein